MKKDISGLLKQIEEGAADLHPVQKRIIKNALNNLEQTFESEGEFTSYDDTKRLLWEYAVLSAKKDVRAIATNRQALSGFGFAHNQKLIDIQAGVVENGVKVERIFAVSKADYEQFDFMELVRSQLKAGIDVWIAYANTADYINSDLEKDHENYVIIDDDLLYRSYVVGEEFRNSVSFDKGLVKKYLDMYEELRARSHHVTKEDLPKAYTEL